MAERPDNAIEEIMAAAMWRACEGMATEDHMALPTWETLGEPDKSRQFQFAQAALAALDAAGLAVVPKDSAAMDAWIKKWTFEGGIYDDAPAPPKT